MSCGFGEGSTFCLTMITVAAFALLLVSIPSICLLGGDAGLIGSSQERYSILPQSLKGGNFSGDVLVKEGAA